MKFTCERGRKKGRRAGATARGRKERDRRSTASHFSLSLRAEGSSSYYSSNRQWSENSTAKRVLVSPQVPCNPRLRLPLEHKTRDDRDHLHFRLPVPGAPVGGLVVWRNRASCATAVVGPPPRTGPLIARCVLEAEERAGRWMEQWEMKLERVWGCRQATEARPRRGSRDATQKGPPTRVNHHRKVNSEIKTNIRKKFTSSKRIKSQESPDRRSSWSREAEKRDSLPGVRLTVPAALLPLTSHFSTLPPAPPCLYLGAVLSLISFLPSHGLLCHQVPTPENRPGRSMVFVAVRVTSTMVSCEIGPVPSFELLRTGFRR